MKRLWAWGLVLAFFIIIGMCGYWIASRLGAPPDTAARIAPETVAQYIHAIIEANRTVYTTNIVDKMQERDLVRADEHWKAGGALPLPAQFLMDTGRLVAQKGMGITYRLASLTPIYVWNAPTTDFERRGLEAVSKYPQRPYTAFVRVGQKQYFQAVYADLAVSQTCVTCHNAHPNSPRRDYKLNDVMGGIVITIPIAQ
jgi:hypothetical protein